MVKQYMQPNFKLNSRKSQTLYALRLLPFIKLEAIFVLIESITIKIYFIRMLSTLYMEIFHLMVFSSLSFWNVVFEEWKKRDAKICYAICYIHNMRRLFLYIAYTCLFIILLTLRLKEAQIGWIAKANDDVHDAWLLDMESCTYFILWSYLAKQLYHGKGAQIKFIAHKRLRMMSKI